MKKINRIFICLITLLLTLNIIYAEEEVHILTTDANDTLVTTTETTNETTNETIDNKEAKKYERTEENNYGVKKDYEITSYNKDHVLKTPYVDASQKLYDFADILTDEEERILKEKIAAYIEKTNMDLVIVTFNEDFTEQQNIAYADDFYDYNDFALDYENYSGTILIRNTNKFDPYYYMGTTGNARLYYDDRLDYILDSIYYDIKSGNYLKAFNNYIGYLNLYYDKGISETMKGYEIGEKGQLVEKYVVPYKFILIGASIATLITMLILVSKNKMVKKSTEANSYMDKNSIKYRKKDKKLISSNTVSHVNSSNSSGGGHGGGSFGGGHIGSSGGFHGGGGRHG